ncbi:MAG: tetratricopeptide repeat protein [Spirochaetaceae bacterium]|jgi:tetratricopeptide (TPR) repeat protein|nr:tetratricopeptide repeat protein [Spirochaetaceae bacterium]
MYTFKKCLTKALGLISCGALLFFVSCASTKLVPPEAVSPAAPPQTFAERLALVLETGNIDGALALFDDLSPEEAEQRGNRRLKASILISAGRLDEARAIADVLISEDGSDVESRFILANIEGASGKPKERRLMLEKIVEEVPAHTPSLNALGHISREAKSFRTAASYFDRVLAIEPDNIRAIEGRAQVFFMERNYQKAEELFNKLVALYPEHAEAYGERGHFYRETGNMSRALEDLETAKRLDPFNPWTAYDKGCVLLKMGKRQEALAEFDYASKLDPNKFIFYVYSAGIRDELEDVDGAAHDFEAIVRLRPDYYFAFEGLGVQQMKKGLYANAAQSFAAAYKSAPDENNYALLAAVNMLKSGVKLNEVKAFLDSVMRKVDRSKLDYHVLRLFFDLSGDSEVARRIDKEKSERIKAQMLFYLANYYDIKGNNLMADKFFIEFREMKRMDLVEWRLNEWILKTRNIQIGGVNVGGGGEKG